ncbi:MAG: Transcriptional regulator, HxlR family, partial [uncultured Solirubrobacteraceae bacterium]
ADSAASHGVARGARRRRRPLDAAGGRRPAGGSTPLRRPAVRSRRHRLQRARAALEASRVPGRPRRRALHRPPAALRLRADRLRSRSGRRAPSAHRLGRPSPRRRTGAPARGVRQRVACRLALRHLRSARGRRRDRRIALRL